MIKLAGASQEDHIPQATVLLKPFKELKWHKYILLER